MDERRKINAQHKYKDKRRNAKPGNPTGANKKTTQSKNPAAGDKTAAAAASRPSVQRRSSTSSSDSDDPYSSRQFSKRTIVRNWDKYNLDDARAQLGSAAATSEDASQYEQMSAADFGELLRAPAAEGAHFRFSSEKNWDADESDLFGTQFFRMNVSQMERQLLRVPFHERQGYATEIFTANELTRMEEAANKENEAWQNQRAKPEATGDAIAPNDVDKDLDALLEMVSIGKGATAIAVESPVISESIIVKEKEVLRPEGGPQPAAVSTAPADDLQQWLDDILDD